MTFSRCVGFLRGLETSLMCLSRIPFQRWRGMRDERKEGLRVALRRRVLGGCSAGLPTYVRELCCATVMAVLVYKTCVSEGNSLSNVFIFAVFQMGLFATECDQKCVCCAVANMSLFN